MNPFSYLSVLTSIVLALGITRVLTGLGKLLQARDRIRIYRMNAKAPPLAPPLATFV
jgi:hypothetical protein